MEELAEYHGSISKRQAEEILNEAGRDGSYLIRDSMSSAGSYCVCVLCDGWIYTYRVFKQKDALWTIEVAPGMKERLFRKVSNLIAAFKIPDQGISVPLLTVSTCCSVNVNELNNWPSHYIIHPSTVYCQSVNKN
uniref:SH2 domain containing 1A duplicate a n=1 Tax=Sinocyclocheilus anshuiensis TaxID=1608454 RepID=A0A671MZC8_9TELE